MIFVGIGTAAVFVLLGWVIKYKGAYWLISGYNTMSAEKKGKVDTIGLGRFMGNMLFIMAAILLAAFVCSHFGLHLVATLAFATILPVTIIIIIRAQKFDGNTRDPEGRMTKGSKATVATVVTLLILLSAGTGWFLFYVSRPAEFCLQEGILEISGIYGKSINLAEINEVELVEEMPEIAWKNNGLDFVYIRKGHFSLIGQGEAILNVNISKPPFIRLDTDSGLFIINERTSEQTRELYQDILDQLDQ
jgi:hypothetical protein